MFGYIMFSSLNFKKISPTVFSPDPIRSAKSRDQVKLANLSIPRRPPETIRTVISRTINLCSSCITELIFPTVYFIIWV